MSDTLLIGTTKGAFLAHDTGNHWTLDGPHCEGWPINHMGADPCTGRIWAGGGSDWHGAGVWCSEDRGQRWTLSKLADGLFDTWRREDPEMTAKFGAAPPAPFSGTFDTIWSVKYAHGRVYAGAKPAKLLVSDDGGASFAEVSGLSDHPSAQAWQPGAAGLTLHTIVSDPGDAQKMWLGISAAGVFATEDGGRTWERRNRRDNAAGGADEVGLCVHNMVRARLPSGQDVLYQQNHHGVFRSGDGGRSWTEITDGLPSDFGFPVAVHPGDPYTLWVLPLNGDSQGRYPPDASAAIWRSRDAGESWEKRQTGLPAHNCYFTVLRQSMACTDTGLYFGTNTGSIFASTNLGDSWIEIARHLPTILSVEAMT